MARGWGRGCCGRWRGAVSGRVCSSSPPSSIPGPHEVTGQDLKEDKEDQPAPQILPPPPAPLSPARPQRDGRGARGEGGWEVVSRPTGGSQGWHWGHRVRRDSGPTREGCPGHSQSRYGWVGGKCLLKDQGGGPTSRSLARGQGGAGAVQDQSPVLPPPPRAGWGEGGGSPAAGTLSGITGLGPLCCGTLPSPARGQHSPLPLVSPTIGHRGPTRWGGRGWFPTVQRGSVCVSPSCHMNVPLGVQGTLNGVPPAAPTASGRAVCPQGCKTPPHTRCPRERDHSGTQGQAQDTSPCP